MERVADLGANAPGTVAHAEGFDGDGLAPDSDRAAIAPGLVEMAVAQVVRIADRVEGQMDLDLLGVGIEVVDLVAAEGLEAAIVDAVREPDVGQVLVLRDRQMP